MAATIDGMQLELTLARFMDIYHLYFSLKSFPVIDNIQDCVGIYLR